MGCDDSFEPVEVSNVNEEMVRRVMKRIERDQNWDQDYWALIRDEEFADKLEVEPLGLSTMPTALRLGDSDLQSQDLCKTAFCAAGHTVLEAGEIILINSGTMEATYCLTDEGEIKTIYQRAKELLGLAWDQADFIFSASAGDAGLESYKQIVTMATGVTFD